MAVAIQKIVKFLFNDKPEKQRENTIRSSYEYMEKNIRQSKKASVRENMYRRLRKKLRQLHVLGIHNHVDECSMWKIMVLQMAMTLINNLISRKCWGFFFFSFKRTKKSPSGQNAVFRNEENFLVKVLFPRDLFVFYPLNLLLP